MSIFKNPDKLLPLILWLVAIHSFLVGLALMFMPNSWFGFFGFDIDSRFFSSQGGIFHVVICMAYIMGALDPIKNKGMVVFSYTAKFTATVFLISYFAFMEPIITVLLSGIGDFLLGLVIFYLYNRFRKIVI